MPISKVFINRARELKWLEDAWASRKPQLLLVYGRRRIGKTRLVMEWAKDKDVFYFLAEEMPERRMLERLSKELAEFVGDELLAERPFTSWRQLLIYLARLSEDRRLGIVIDEFQYAVESSPGLLSTIQSLWDTRLSSTKILMVLMGSLVSFSEGILSQRNPLYGRITGVLRLNPLSPLEVRCFVPQWGPSDALRLYGVFGGIPGYLVEVDASISLWDNIGRLVLAPNARFLDEAKLMLKEELREVSRYYAVLEAIANGAAGFGEIASRSMVPAESLSKYLRVLEEMGILDREYPVAGRGRARYRIADRFMEFWFRYIPRYRSAIELGFTGRVLEAVREDFEKNIMPRVWEEAARAMVAELARRRELKLTPTMMGRWWHRGAEIDLVALDETRGEKPVVLFLEAKWSSLDSRTARRELDRLRAKAQLFPVKWGKAVYVLAAREAEKPDLLSDEMVLTIEDFDRLSKNACSTAPTYS